MWIVQLALRRPYTTLCLPFSSWSRVRSNLPHSALFGPATVSFPKKMSDRIVSVTERNLTTVVENIEHIESQSGFLASRSSRVRHTLAAGCR